MNHLVVLGISLFLAFILVGGFFRNVFSPTARDEFIRWHYPPWFRFVVGSLELAAAVLLFIPGERWVALALIAIVMVAAAVTLIVHKEFAHTAAPLSILALTIILALLTRNELPYFIGVHTAG